MGVNLVKLAPKTLHGVKMRIFKIIVLMTPNEYHGKKMKMLKNQMLVSTNITFFETFVITLCFAKHLVSTFLKKS
jgi:hypothetical protein